MPEKLTFNGVPLDAGPSYTVVDIEPPYMPLSARVSRSKRLRWWWKGFRERVALRLAPWLDAG